MPRTVGMADDFMVLASYLTFAYWSEPKWQNTSSVTGVLSLTVRETALQRVSRQVGKLVSYERISNLICMWFIYAYLFSVSDISSNCGKSYDANTPWLCDIDFSASLVLGQYSWM